MKQLVVLGTLFSATLITGAAYAQPALTAPTEQSADAATPAQERSLPPIYVGAGAELGGNLNLMTGLYGEAGIAVRHDVFVHARIARGDASDLSEALGSTKDRFAVGDSRYTQGRVGLELHTCTKRGGACVIYGADLGVLGTSPSTGPTTDTMSYRYLEEQIIPRVGLDVGGSHLRARFGIETAIGAAQRWSDASTDVAHDYGVQGTTLNGGLAYAF